MKNKIFFNNDTEKKDTEKKDIIKFRLNYKKNIFSLIYFLLSYFVFFNSDVTASNINVNNKKTYKNNNNYYYRVNNDTKDFLIYKNDFDLKNKISKLLDEKMISFFINIYKDKNLSREQIINYIAEGILILDKEIFLVWNNIQKSNNPSFNFISKNLIEAYGSSDNVVKAIHRLILLENTGHKNTIRDVFQFYIELKMHNNIRNFKSNIVSNKGAIGLCQLTNIAVQEVNSKIFKNDQNNQIFFKDIASNSYYSIFYMMALNAINYDRLMNDISLDEKKITYKKDDTDISLLLKSIKNEKLKTKLIEMLLAFSYNNGYLTLKNVSNRLINQYELKKTSKNNNNALNIMKKLIQNLPKETQLYAVKLNSLFKYL